MSYSVRKSSACLLTIVACATCNARTARSVSHLQKSIEIAHGGCDPKKTIFRATVAADGPSADRSTRLSYHGYKASSGLTMQTVFGDFDSPSGAKAELEYRAKLASKIIVRGVKLDPKGNVIGERVEALLPREGSKNLSVFDVMWTSGRYFHEVGSSFSCKQAVLPVEKNIRDPN